MESVGARLKKIRLEKGLSLEEAHKRTKIKLNILKSLEDDALQGVSPVYIKGFLKIYCKFLGVNPREYIPDYKDASGIERLMRKESSAANPKADFSGLLNLLSRIRIKPLVIALLVIFALIGMFKLGKAISLKSRSTFTRKTLPPAQAKPAQKSAEPVKKSESAAAVAAVKTAKAPVSAVIRVGIQAKENCNLTLKADGKVVFQGNLRKGISDSWQAKEKIEFSLNNAGAVNLQINGKAISELGRRGQAIKGVVTKDGGLSILR